LNLGLRFGVELATFVSLGYWGASFDVSSVAVRALLAVTAPLVATVAWSCLLAPRAPGRLTGLAALMVELSLFAPAAAALLTSGRGLVGGLYASVATLNSFLTRSLGQYAPANGTPAQERRP
jgi:hypothetical protein